MKIGISCYPTFGGSGVVASELAMALAEEGDEVHVISYAPPMRLSLNGPHLHFHEVAVPRYPLFEYPPYSLALAAKMVEVTRLHRLDLMHVHYAVPNAVSAILARLIVTPGRLPVVTTLHGTDVTLVGTDPSYLEPTRWSIEQSDAVTAVSEALREATYRRITTRKLIEVIPNFIDPRRCGLTGKGAGVRRWVAKEEKAIVHISNFRPLKRLDDVVEVFERVRKRITAHLVLVGDGPERPRIEQKVRESGSFEDVTFLGNVPAVEEILSGADLFLLPSETESFGLAALEALACEVPVIATRTGGLPEVVEHGVQGFLFPVGAVQEMAEAALGLLLDSEAHRRISQSARSLAIERFGRDRIVPRYRAAYEGLLAST